MDDASVYLPLLGVALIVLLSFGAVAVFVVPPLRRLLGQQRANTALMLEGTPAGAKVISAQQTGTMMQQGGYESHQIAIQLQVEPKSELAFVATATMFVSVLDLSKAQPGASAVVRYSSTDKSQVVITNLLGTLSTLVDANENDEQQAYEMIIESEILQEDLRRRGIPASAQVRESDPTGIVVQGGTAEMTRLSLLVKPDSGSAFAAQTTAAIATASMHKVQPGADITVSYDPDAPSRAIVTALPQ